MLSIKRLTLLANQTALPYNNFTLFLCEDAGSLGEVILLMFPATA